MPANPTTQRMGELHELFLAEINGGTKTTSSGNQWHDQGDGRDTHDAPFAFCWDGKSTRGQQIAVTLAMIAKIREQSQGERPQIGLRWYANDALDQVTEDWIAIQAADFEEMKLAAIRCAELDEELVGVRCELGEVRTHRDALREEVELVTGQRDLEGRNALRMAEELGAARQALEAASAAGTAADPSAARESVESLQEVLKAVEADRDRFRELAIAAQKGKLIPAYVPRLPWTVVYRVRLPGRSEFSGMHYDADGNMTPFEISTVRVERSIGNRPRLIVNELRVPDGDLYTDGMLIARVCQGDASIEAG